MKLKIVDHNGEAPSVRVTLSESDLKLLLGKIKDPMAIPILVSNKDDGTILAVIAEEDQIHDDLDSEDIVSPWNSRFIEKELNKPECKSVFNKISDLVKSDFR